MARMKVLKAARNAFHFDRSRRDSASRLDFFSEV
jgi:hypothetical protein